MSSERLSRNETALTPKTLLLRKDVQEGNNRRGSEEHPHYRFRSPTSPRAQATTKPRYPRYIPSANVAQLLLDLMLIGGCQAVVLTLIRSRLDLYSLTEALAVAGLSTLISLILLYSTGCYRRDALIERGLRFRACRQP